MRTERGRLICFACYSLTSTEAQKKTMFSFLPSFLASYLYRCYCCCCFSHYSIVVPCFPSWMGLELFRCGCVRFGARIQLSCAVPLRIPIAPTQKPPFSFSTPVPPLHIPFILLPFLGPRCRNMEPVWTCSSLRSFLPFCFLSFILYLDFGGIYIYIYGFHFF